MTCLHAERCAYEIPVARTEDVLVDTGSDEIMLLGPK
jgi:hypothetical protein